VVQALDDIAPFVALGAAALALALAVVVTVLWTRLQRVHRAQQVVLGGGEQRDIVAHVEMLDVRVRNLRQAVEILGDELGRHKEQLDLALTNMAIVRYDAFRESGGAQSATVALLDAHRSGLVISTIAARDFARLYVKTLEGGVPDRELSPEESSAVAAAVPAPLPPGGASAPGSAEGRGVEAGRDESGGQEAGRDESGDQEAGGPGGQGERPRGPAGHEGFGGMGPG
jgi:hypothetical protein